MTALKTSPDNPTVASIEELDFSKYRTKELANRVGDLVSIPKSVGRLAITIFLCVFTVAILVYWLMRIDGQDTIFRFAGQSYGFVTSVIFAIALWIVLLIRRSLAALTAIVDLLLGTTIQVAKDYKELGQGQKKLPPMAKLVGAVYEHVFMHALKEVCSSAVGFLGIPIYWVFSLTVGRMLSVVIKQIATWTASDNDKAEMKKAIDDLMPELAENESKTLAGLCWARGKISSSGKWLSKRVLWPCYAILGAFFAVLAAPILAALVLN